MNRFLRTFREHPILSALLVGLFLALLFVVRNLVSGDDPRIQAIRAAGYPVTLSDLNQYYPGVPPDRNAALRYEEVFASPLFTTLANDFFPKDDLRRGEPLPEEFRRALAESRAAHPDAWELLYSATNLAGSRYPVDFQAGYNFPLPHLGKIKSAVTLLSLEALSHASASEPERAAAAFQAALHAGESIRNEPCLISCLVRIACSAVAAKRLEQSLNLVAFKEADLRALQERFGEMGRDQGAVRALAGERVEGLSVFLDRQIQRTVVQPPPGQGGGTGPVPPGWAGRVFLSVYKASGLMAKDRTTYLDVMATTVALAEMKAPDRIRAAPTVSLIPTNRFLLFSRMLLPALQRALDRVNEHAARMCVAETALAVERFRITHDGALPATLAELAPVFMASTPTDPFDGQALRFKPLPGGFVVYSVGPDLKDDSGSEPGPGDRKFTGTRVTPKDLTFTVQRK